MADDNAIIIEAWNTVLFDKFCRFEHLLVSGLSGHSDAALARYGFAEDPDVPEILRSVTIPGYEYKEMQNSFFLGEITIIIPKHPDMIRWRAVLFERMARNALRASTYFRIPPNRVVGLGAQVELGTN